LGNNFESSKRTHEIKINIYLHQPTKACRKFNFLTIKCTEVLFLSSHVSIIWCWLVCFNFSFPARLWQLLSAPSLKFLNHFAHIPMWDRTQLSNQDQEKSTLGGQKPSIHFSPFKPYNLEDWIFFFLFGPLWGRSGPLWDCKGTILWCQALINRTHFLTGAWNTHFSCTWARISALFELILMGFLLTDLDL
jgi:hypothetical protein